MNIIPELVESYGPISSIDSQAVKLPGEFYAWDVHGCEPISQGSSISERYDKVTGIGIEPKGTKVNVRRLYVR